MDKELEKAPVKILSVDDEMDLELLLTQYFRRKIRKGEYEFYFAHNGLEALTMLLKVKDIDIILSDINMPEMDGLTLLTKVNEMQNPALKCIMVSAYGDMGNITEMNITGVRVKLDNGEVVDVPQYDFKTQIFEDGETQTIGGIKQLPLKLAWAITVHKSQGQTFDKVNFLYDKGFFDGANENRTLLYVGLSRARKIENLYLRIKGNLPRFNNEAIVDFYNGKYKTYTSRFDGMIGF